MMQAQSKASGNMVFKNTSKDIANTFSTSMCMFHVNPKLSYTNVLANALHKYSVF